MPFHLKVALNMEIADGAPQRNNDGLSLLQSAKLKKGTRNERSYRNIDNRQARLYELGSKTTHSTMARKPGV